MQTILDLFRLDNKSPLSPAPPAPGAAIATALAQAGATVAVHGNRRAATETAAAIGSKAAAFRADLSSTEGASELFGGPRQVRPGRRPRHNAGTIVRHAAEGIPARSWQTSRK
jgi:2-deoxy-D-gluconate 3-dehydrogenase